MWAQEFKSWQQRDLSAKAYVYLWVDGVYFQVRMEEAKHCVLIVMGATEDGKKELAAISDGYRESEQSWKEVLLELVPMTLLMPFRFLSSSPPPLAPLGRVRRP